MAIIDLSPEVGLAGFVPVAVQAAGQASAEHAPDAANVAPQDSATLFTHYSELRDVAARTAHFEGPAVDDVRADVRGWLTERTAAEAADPAVDAETAAVSRVRDLATHLRYRGWPVGLFEMDASDALAAASVAHSREVAAGTATSESFPPLGDDAERAMPLLHYVPEDQRSDLLNGLPAPVTALVPTAEQPEDRPRGLWAGVRRLGSRAFEAVRNLGHGRDVGRVALAFEVSTDPPAKPEVEQISAQSAPDREIIDANGNRLRIVSFYDMGDPAYAALTEKVVAGRLREYQSHGLLEPDAKRDDIRGPHVEFMAVLNEEGEVVASLRKIHATGINLSALPSFQKFIGENALDPEGSATLFDHAEPNRAVVEIAGLWKNDDYDTGVKIELYKAAMQDSIARDELWFMGIVQAEYAGLLRSYGKHVVHTLGHQVEVKGEGATSGVRLRPVMVEPRTFYDDLAAEMRDASAAGDRITLATRGALLGEFLMGMRWDLLNMKTRQTLEGVFQGVYS